MANVGDFIKFGRYPQSANGDIRSIYVFRPALWINLYFF